MPRNQSLQQQVQKLTRAFHNFLPDEHNDGFVSKDDSHDDSNQWLVGNVDTGAVEESKEVDDQEVQSNSVSSSLSGDTILAPPTYIDAPMEEHPKATEHQDQPQQLR